MVHSNADFELLLTMNCFSGMDDREKAFILIFSQVAETLTITNAITQPGGFQPAQNLSSGSVKWNCAVGITTTSQRNVWVPGTFQHLLFFIQSNICLIYNVHNVTGFACLFHDNNVQVYLLQLNCYTGYWSPKVV